MLDGGTEFYKKDIIHLIVPFLRKTNINFKALSKQEINELTRCNRIRNIIKKIDTEYFIHILKTINEKIVYEPRIYQADIIHNSVNYFKNHDKGLLILPCGIGKTLISLWITKKLHSKTVLIGVPSIVLLEQRKIIIYNLFQDVSIFVIADGVSDRDIIRFLETNQIKCIVLTTYSSSH